MGLASPSGLAVVIPREPNRRSAFGPEIDQPQTPLLVLIFLAPESPWWLVRHGRTKEALRSIERLGKKSKQNSHEALAMIERTVEIETQMGGSPSLLDLVRGTDLRRTIITCLVYAGQNFAGNLIANQATFFFEREWSCSDIVTGG